jgi:signal-transduction protein with cAMP-binding, CBS, and nucleotidyltransferase domain
MDRPARMHTLEEYKFRQLVTSPPDETVSEAAAKMENHNVGCVIVTRDREVLGIATRYDFIHGVIVSGKDPATTKISRIMHSSPISIEPQATMTDALKKMIERKVERLLVRSECRILGVISLEDVVASLSNEMLSSLSQPRYDQIFDMVRRLTPSLVSRYEGEERELIQREMNDETRALLRLLEEAEVTLRR